MNIIPLLLMLLQGLVQPITSSASLKTLDGNIVKIDLRSKGKATVIYFLSPECPLCQSYTLNIKTLAQKYQSKGFQFIAIVPGKEFSPLQVKQFVETYQLNMLPFYFDPKLDLVHSLKASITPEVFVINKSGQTIYSGRIDNWAYELGRKRTIVTEHDLENVLKDIASNKKVVYRKTKAIGCYIE